jgi:hypothetical protein
MAAKTKKLSEIAKVIRSKNSGPFELTLDVICGDRESYETVKRSGALSAAAITAIFGIPEKDVLVAEFFDQAMAFKATIVRPTVSGSIRDTDTYGCQHGAPLQDILIPLD